MEQRDRCNVYPPGLFRRSRFIALSFSGVLRASAAHGTTGRSGLVRAPVIFFGF
jgi:hypothetical protein